VLIQRIKKVFGEGGKNAGSGNSLPTLIKEKEPIPGIEKILHKKKKKRDTEANGWNYFLINPPRRAGFVYTWCQSRSFWDSGIHKHCPF
jgi:hypothetical protein